MAISIYDFADIIGKNLIITYYSNQGRRFTAQFEGSEIIEKGREYGLCGTYGDANTSDLAVCDYCRKISGQKIVFDAFNEKRKEFNIPELEC